jgi:hypothetical protein
MPIDVDEIVSATTDTSGALLSEKDRQIILSALSEVDNRERWEKMSDEEWDVFHAWLGTAYENVLVDVPIGGGDGVAIVKEASRTTVQAFQDANIVHSLAWENGDYDPTNTSRVYVGGAGLQTVIFNGELFANGASATNQIWLYLNGTTILSRAFQIMDSNETTLVVSLVAQAETDENAYFEVQTVSTLLNRVGITLKPPKITVVTIPTS